MQVLWKKEMMKRRMERGLDGFIRLRKLASCSLSGLLLGMYVCIWGRYSRTEWIAVGMTASQILLCNRC